MITKNLISMLAVLGQNFNTFNMKNCLKSRFLVSFYKKKVLKVLSI